MAVVYVRSTATTDASTAASSLLVTDFTSTSGNLILVGMVVRNSTSSPLIFMTGGGLTWNVLLTGSAAAGTLDFGVWYATSAGAAMTISGTYGPSATGGMGAILVTEVSGHNGVGVSYTTGSAGTILNGSIVTTSNSSGVWAFNSARSAGGATPVDAVSAGFSIATALLTTSTVLGVQMTGAHDDDVGIAASIPFVWGNDTGTSGAGPRHMILVEVIASGTVIFNYNLLEHRVMRGAGRGVMRGVA